MTTKIHDFEGWTNGATITASGTGSGDNFDTPVIGAGSTIVATTTSPIRGTKSGLYTYASGVSAYTPISVAATDRLVTQCTFVYISSPTISDYLGSLRSTSGNMMSALVATSTNKMSIQNAASGNPTGQSSTTWPVLTVGHTYRLDMAATKGTTTSNGRIEVKLTDLTSSTVVYTYDDSTNNTGTAQGTTFRCGRYTNVAATWAVKYDDVQVGDMSSGLFGVPGTVTLSGSLTADVTSGVAPLTITATCAMVGLGTTTTYNFDWGDGSTSGAQSSNVASHTYNVPGTFGPIQCTVVTT